LNFLTERFLTMADAVPIRPGVTGGGGTTYDDDMEARVTALETRLNTILPTLATKDDISRAEGSLRADILRGINETHRWMIATVVGLFLGFGGLFLAMSNALKPSAAPSAATAPIVINVPTPATASPSQPAKPN
jgi:hypothetical protein